VVGLQSAEGFVVDQAPFIMKRLPLETPWLLLRRASFLFLFFTSKILLILVVSGGSYLFFKNKILSSNLVYRIYYY
jgi:hypothetical protein